MILHVACLPFPSPKGTQAAIHAMLRASASEGRDSHLLTYAHGAYEPDANYTIHRIQDFPKVRSLRSGPSWGKVALDARCVLETRRLAHALRPNAIVAHHIEAATAALAARVGPVYYVAHTSLRHELPVYFPRIPNRLAGRVASALEGRVCAQAAGVAAVAPILSTLLGEGTKYLPVPWSSPSTIDAPTRVRARAELALPRDAQVCLYAGNLDGYQGWERLVEAIDLLQRMNTLVYGEVPGIMTIAEESTAYPSVSGPVHDGGLGFGFKWNMGWMNDTLEYIGMDPVHRKYHHNKLTFGLHYAFSENFILPISHDEVVHGKGSMYERMPGNEWERFANLRTYYGFMWGHPGKKLLFMGCEFAQPAEWAHDGQLDWEAAQRPAHAGVARLVRDLNTLYRAEPALHYKDCEADGFQWLEANDAEHSIVAWLRRGGESDAPVAVVCNFTPVERSHWRLGLPTAGRWREALNSDAAIYGGGDRGNLGAVEADDTAHHGQPCSAVVTLPPLATLYFVLEEPH